MNYLPLINAYGAKLSDYQRPIARRLFIKLLKNGWSYEQIYWGIMLLRGRPIEKYIGLFFYQDFIDEIKVHVEIAQEMINKSYEEKVKVLSLMCGYGAGSIPEEYKEEFYLLDEKIWNSGNEYTKEELQEEVDYIYEKCYLIPMITLPIQEIERKPFKF